MKSVKSKDLKLKPAMNATITAASTRVPLCRCRFCGAVVSLDPVAGEFISEQGGVQVEHCEHLLCAWVRVMATRKEKHYSTEVYVDIEILDMGFDRLRRNYEPRSTLPAISEIVAAILKRDAKPQDIQCVGCKEARRRLPQQWTSRSAVADLKIVFAREGAVTFDPAMQKSRVRAPRNAKRGNRRSAGLRARAIASRRPR